MRKKGGMEIVCSHSIYVSFEKALCFYGPDQILCKIFHSLFPKCTAYKKEIKVHLRSSRVVQWLRICLAMPKTPVQSLVWEDPTCHRATKPTCPYPGWDAGHAFQACPHPPLLGSHELSKQGWPAIVQVHLLLFPFPWEFEQCLLSGRKKESVMRIWSSD